MPDTQLPAVTGSHDPVTEAQLRLRDALLPALRFACETIVALDQPRGEPIDGLVLLGEHMLDLPQA